MLSAPRTPPARCPDGCRCEPCVDDLTAWAATLAANRPGDRWRAVNLKRPSRTRRDPQAALDAFDRHMADPTERVRTWGRADRQDGAT